MCIRDSTVTCPNPACRAEMPLVRQWWLANTGSRKIALKPVVDREAKRIEFEVVNLGREQRNDFDPNEGTSSRGHAECLVCGQIAHVETIRDEGAIGRMSEMPLAVIFEQTNVGKGYRLFATQDAALFREAKTLLASTNDKAPDEPLPPIGTLGFRVQRYGLTRWGDLFNTRQLLALLTFSGRVRAAYETMVTEGMETGRAKAVATYL